MTDLSQHEIAAYHEAGHALAQVLSPHLPPLLSAHVEVNGSGRVESECGWPLPEGRDGLRAQVYENERAFLAGALAEALAVGRVSGCGQDFDWVVRFALLDAVLALGDFDPELADRVAVRLAAAEDADAASAAVSVELAAAGVKPAKLERALGEAFERFTTAGAGAEALVRANWGAIEAIAAELVQLGSITGELIETVIDLAERSARPPIGRGRNLAALLLAAESDPDVAREVQALAHMVGGSGDLAAKQVPVPWAYWKLAQALEARLH